MAFVLKLPIEIIDQIKNYCVQLDMLKCKNKNQNIYTELLFGYWIIEVNNLRYICTKYMNDEILIESEQQIINVEKNLNQYQPILNYTTTNEDDCLFPLDIEYIFAIRVPKI